MTECASKAGEVDELDGTAIGDGAEIAGDDVAGFEVVDTGSGTLQCVGCGGVHDEAAAAVGDLETAGVEAELVGAALCHVERIGGDKGELVAVGINDHRTFDLGFLAIGNADHGGGLVGTADVDGCGADRSAEAELSGGADLGWSGGFEFGRLDLKEIGACGAAELLQLIHGEIRRESGLEPVGVGLGVDREGGGG